MTSFERKVLLMKLPGLFNDASTKVEVKPQQEVGRYTVIVSLLGASGPFKGVVVSLKGSLSASVVTGRIAESGDCGDVATWVRAKWGVPAQVPETPKIRGSKMAPKIDDFGAKITHAKALLGA